MCVCAFVFFQFSKANAQYHKLFKEISNDEILKQSKSILCSNKVRSMALTLSLSPSEYFTSLQTYQCCELKGISLLCSTLSNACVCP